MAKKRADKRGTRKPITKIKFLVEGITEKFYFKELLKFKEYSAHLDIDDIDCNKSKGRAYRLFLWI